jgi:hypothetical protein
MRVGWGSRVKHILCRKAGPPPGAGACHRAGQRPDPLGATLPLSGGGIRHHRAKQQNSNAIALAGILVFASTLTLATPPARAQAPDLGEIHGLKLGLEAPSMSMDGFGELACGSNGGPPRQRLDTWAAFGSCRAEQSGLHEVYARFDDEAEFIGRAIDDPLYAGSRTGTRVAGHPVILSVLFDDAGVLRGLRFISDPRAAPIERRMAHLLRLAVINHYDPAGWACADLAPEPGETPVGGIFIKQRCEKLTPERRMTLEARFLRKRGQSDIDPATGDYTSGQFESSTRFELMDPAYRTP